ncbi:zinc finger protein 462-like [Hypomesus transpacificus]|uniref:zinc finger protein 462-like n=1 Tax=Hypomesus transpacificus TaxID=137520 RepID=UPI001F076B7A|nr:zinc finger protein 462-like [Hypomesus transpacificus]
MEKESRHAHKFEQMTTNQRDSQQLKSQVQSFQCNYCILIFKSKQFLHEHVSKVHGFNVDVPQGVVDSTPLKTGTKSSSSPSPSDYSEDHFSCRYCVFTSYRWTELVNHEKNYHKSGQKSLVKTQAKATVRKNAVNTLGVSPSKLGEKGRLNSSYSMFTSKNNLSHSSLKDLEQHKGSSGTTFSISPSQSTPKSSQSKLKLPNRDSDVQAVMESDSKARHCCLSCSFTSSSFTDLRNHQQQKHGQTTTLWPSLGSSPTNLQNCKPEMADGSVGSATKTTAKRSHGGSSLFPAKKKCKLDTRKHESTVIKTKVSRGSDFNGEVSEDEEANVGAKMVDHPDSANGESSDESERLYCCKHCDYSHKFSRGISCHYQRMHPFVRFTFKYILDQNDSSATYRCLECPIDFTTVDGLKEHYGAQHPEAPDVFMQRSDQLDLVFKCFLCTYTSPKSSFLKIHYRREHAMEETNNPLMFYSYTAGNPQTKPSQSPISTGTSSPNSAISRERVQAQHIDPSRTSPLKSPVSKGVDKEIHRCKYCSYSNTSVVAMVVHYQKKHPNSGATIEQIKQQAAASTPTPEKSPHVSPLKPPKPSLDTSDDAPKDLQKMYFCQVCNYSHPTVKGVFVHQKKKHHELRATALQIHIYSAEVQSHSKKSQLLAKFSPQKGSTSPDSKIQSGFEDMFFCQLCNYGHHAVRGVLNHQRMRHKDVVVNTENVLRHTAMLREKSQTTDGESSPNVFALPLPIVQKGTDQMLFCQFCNFSHSKVKIIANHQFRKHSIPKPSAQEINRYTAMVYEKLEKTQLEDTDLSKPSVKKLSDLRSLKCGTCLYTTPHLYLLKRHMMNKHRIKTTIAEVVRSAWLDGLLEPGYHCQWCVYSNPDARKVQQHYQKCHPLCGGFSLDHITLDLYAGNQASSQASPSTNVSPDSENIMEDQHTPQKATRGGTKTAPSPKPGGKTAKVYPCRACPFKGSSIASVKRHYRAVHPWSVKEDGSVLDVITSRQPGELKHYLGDVHNEMPGSFESYQKPVEDSEELAEGISGDSSHDTSASIRMFKCAVCSTYFNTHHGLMTHCGKKHPDYKPERETEKELGVSVRTSVYRCEVCSYVNTRCHGVLTHCQMKHPSFKARAGRLQTKIVQFPNVQQCVRKRSGRVTLQGYLCKLCPVTHASLKKLKVHNETHRHSTASTKLKTVKTAHVIKKQLLSKYRTTQGSIGTSRGSKRRCHRCAFTCTTMKHLASHINSSHSCTPEHTYTCCVCSYSSVVPVYLANHYRRMHGPDAYRTFFAATHMSLMQKQISDVCPSPTPEGQASLGKASANPLAKLYSDDDLDFHCTSRRPAANSAQERSTKNMTKNRTKKRSIRKLFVKSSGKGRIKCKKCTKYFHSALLLSIHYTNFHSNVFKQDFTILSNTAETDLQLYRCGHCNVKIQGNRKLSKHLDHHAEVLARTKLKPAESESPELPELLTIQELSRWNVTQVETITLKMSPEPSLSGTSDSVDLNKGTDEAEGFPCIQCGRAFMSLKGLRSHERSHAAIASLKRTGTMPKHIIEENIIYRPGTIKQFHCGLCGYKTNLVILLRNHLSKKHEAADVTEYSVKDPDNPTTCEKDAENNLRASEEALDPTGPQKGDVIQEHSSTQKRGYSEPPHVQRQLNHYKNIAKRKHPAADVPQASRAFYDGLYHCEFCNFTSEHISSVRRHYLNRHNGKRLLKCKDCSFFTGLRKRFDMHIDAGGSSCLAEAALMDLRCPFCLYHTKNKNNMIDHIILHREERMVPIEVRRPQLSQYLKDVVFRCHKCTFSSASDENLREHMLKHDDIKPYKCRLCFFDCSQLSGLEAHLCDKHQVVRNHELVGQVSLEQLETKLNGKEKGKSNMEPWDKEEEDHGTTLKHDKQGEESDDSNLEQPSAMEVENLAKHTEEEDKDMEGRDEMEEKLPEPTRLHGTPWQVKAEDTTDPNEGQLDQKPGTDMKHGVVAEADKKPENTAGPNMVHHEKHERTDIEQNSESHEMLGQEGQFRANCQKTGQFHGLTMDRKSEGGLIHQGQGLTEENGQIQHIKVTENKDLLEESFVDCKEVYKEKNKGELADQYGEMPILENVYIKQEEYNSQDERLDDVVVKQDKSKCNKTEEQGCEEGSLPEEPDERAENLELSKEGLQKENYVVSAPQDSCTFLKSSQLTSNVKSFSCKLCGRTLSNSTEFERHVMRHGM